MSIKSHHDTFDKIWFITFTCFNWLPLIETSNSHDLVYNWLHLIKEKGQADTLGFVIMPNHVHLLLQLNSKTVNLNTMVGNAKRFMAYELVKRLKENGQRISVRAGSLAEDPACFGIPPFCIFTNEH